MSFRARSYPHPVLSPFARDYVDQSEIYGEFDRSSEDGKLVISYSIHLTSDRLDEFRADARAKLALDIYSKGSRWRSLEFLDHVKGAIEIPEGLIFGTVEVTPVLLATEDTKFEFAGINGEYSANTFLLQEGDLLALGPTESLEADHQRSSQDKEDFIKLQLSPALDPNEYEVQVNSDQIIIFAGQNVTQVTNALRADVAMRPYLFMSLYKDAFVVAIKHLLATYRDEEEPEEAWAKGMTAYIDSKELSLDEIEGEEDSSIEKFVLRMIATDGLGAVAKRIQDGKALA